ncbi:MAG: acetamidase/formamidase family protein [Thermomicrobiales bacterium]|nr:acetamidase/formamidase family protein [Thermomicrobiales bacterium]
MRDGVQHHQIGREAIHTFWDNALPPRLTIAPGDSVVFETLEPSRGQVAREIASGAKTIDAEPALIALVAESAYPEPPLGPENALDGHALTGPVAIAGAEPGDTLVVEVLEIVPAAWGWTSCGPSGGLLANEFPEWTRHLWDLRSGDVAVFAPGIHVPMAPFCGVMGVAPAEPGRHATPPPRRVGGNLDIRQLTAGATLLLPVETPGALFSTGDAHAAQGDGEVAGTAIEMDATVTLRFDLRKGENRRGPQFHTPAIRTAAGPWFAASGSHTDLYEAAREALRGVLDEIQQCCGLDRAKACILASACVDLRISQVVNAGTYTVTALLPLSIFTD